MNLLSAPRQPFVGLALFAGAGIVTADFLPCASLNLMVAVALGVIVLLAWPSSILSYVLVSVAFYWMHSFRLQDSPGQRLAAQLGNSPRAITAVGAVVSEPKVAANGLASFLLRLESLEVEEKAEPASATILARWRGNPSFGDELQLFGIADAIAAPRN